MKNLAVVVIGLLATLYILNPGMGFFELIPDTVPLIGNLDEAAAVALLLMCLKYFGIDLPDIFRRGDATDKTINIK